MSSRDSLSQNAVGAGSAACKTDSLHTSSLLEEAYRALQRDLPSLLQERYGQWVLYHGPVQVAVADSQFGVYEQAARLGYRKAECLVQCILEEPEAIEPNAFTDK